MAHYVLEQRIAVGGMAEIFRARREENGVASVCAVKRLLPSADASARLRLQDEARAGQRLRHPNIVAVSETFELDGVLHLAMEYVDGVSVDRLIERGLRGRFIPLDVIGTIVIDTLKALRFAHLSNVLHRDVSASNILLSAAGEVKLSDFGIAKTEANLSSTTPGHVMGKAEYLSAPRRRGASATPADDFFALGIVLERLLSAADPRERLRSSAAPLLRLREQLVAVASPDDPHRHPADDEIEAVLCADAAAIASFLQTPVRRSPQKVPGLLTSHDSLDGTTLNGDAASAESRRHRRTAAHRKV